MRRAIVPLLLLPFLLSACGQRDCSHVAGIDSIQIQIPKAIQGIAPILRVELCQGKTCASLNFPSKRAAETGDEVADGVVLVDDDAYRIDLAAMGKHVWRTRTETGLTVLGVTPKGRPVLNHTEQFTFEGYYPNGKQCDDRPSVRYSTSVGGEDLVG